MKFLSVTMENFKPYFNTPDNGNHVVFFDKSRKDRKICINVGQTGSGKTSLSEAILWCLFGELYKPNWSKWVSTNAIDLAKEKKHSEVSMQVTLEIDLDGDRFELERTGTFHVGSQQFEPSKLNVICKGIVDKNPEKFIKDNFPTAALMQYFVFDVDDFLKKFEENIQKRIRIHIEKFAEIEKLDTLIKSLENACRIIDSEIRLKTLESADDESIASEVVEMGAEKSRKMDAIRSLETECKQLTKNMNELFKDALTPEEEKFFKLAERKEELLSRIDGLNDEFTKDKELVRDMDLVLLREVMHHAVGAAKARGTTKSEFETSSDVIRAALGKKYSGIVFKSKDEMSLIKNAGKIPKNVLVPETEISFSAEEGGKVEALSAFNKYLSRSENAHSSFVSLRSKLAKLDTELIQISSKLDIMGGKAKDKDSLEKFRRYKQLEDKRAENERTIKEISDQIEKIQKDLKVKSKELKLTQTEQEEKDALVRQEEYAGRLLDLAKRTREDFLRKLLEFVNEKSSVMLRTIAKESDRWHSIEVHSDFRFEIKNSRGAVIDTGDQTNRGNLQLSLMCFVFGLADYLQKDIPYVLDDPFIRLDPGYNRRLIEQLCKVREQLILHLIPGSEYTPDYFSWLQKNVNCQNWIQRERLYDDWISRVAAKDSDSQIAYDVDKL